MDYPLLPIQQMAYKVVVCGGNDFASTTTGRIIAVKVVEEDEQQKARRADLEAKLKKEKRLAQKQSRQKK